MRRGSAPPAGRAGRAAALAALAIVLAAALGVLASASRQGPTLPALRVVARTRLVSIDQRTVVLVVDLEVRRIGRGATVRVSCRACGRLAGRTRVRRTSATKSLIGVNWLLSPGRVLTVTETAHSAVGRFVVLGPGSGSQLIRLRVGCLSPAGRREPCPASGPSSSTTAASTTASQTTAAGGAITLAATFDTGIGSLTPQCAPLTPSKPPRLRGTYELESSIVGQGTQSLEITLPTDTDLSTYPLEACGLITREVPIGLGSDGYYGLMIYVPVGWTIPNSAFGGVNVYELHFQNIYGAPITLQVHPHHVTIALETGGCENHTTPHPGCTWRSNADAPPGASPTLPGYYAIPPGAFVQGAWNEVILHVLWSNTTAGLIQSYYRVAGAPSWRRGSTVSGIPTVQWDNAIGCCDPSDDDQLEAYTYGVTAPLSIWLDNVVDGTSLLAVEAAMP